MTFRTLGILALALTFTSLVGLGRDYIPLVEQGRSWNYTLYYNPDGATDQNPGTAKIVIDGQTQIDGKVYAKCYLHSFDSKLAEQPTPYVFLREDVRERKVWARLNPDYHYSLNDAAYTSIGVDKEYLLYDFSTPSINAEAFQGGRFWDRNYTGFRESYPAAEYPSQEAVFKDEDGRLLFGYQSTATFLIEGVGYYCEYLQYANLFNITYQSRFPSGPFFTLKSVTDATGDTIANLNHYPTYIEPVKKERIYKPMLVQGRTWEYLELTQITNFDQNGYEVYDSELHNLTLKLDGTASIVGTNYTVCYAYYDEYLEPDQATPYCYLRETDYGDVFVLANPDYKYKHQYTVYPYHEQLLMSMECPGYSPNRLDLTTTPWDWTFSPTAYRGLNGEVYAGFDLGENGYMVEGLGPIHLIHPMNLIGIQLPVYGWINHGLTFLYSIEDTDGTLIFRNPEYERAAIPLVSIEVQDTAVYFDLQGRQLSKEPTLPGTYIKKTGSKVEKVMVR